MSWYVRTAERHIGPISEQALRAMAATGQLGPDARIWRNGMAEWAVAADVDGILPAADSAPLQAPLSDRDPPLQLPLPGRDPPLLPREGEADPAPTPHDFSGAIQTVNLATPWRRFWARGLDLLVGAALVGFTLGALRPSIFYGYFAAHEQQFGLLIFPIAVVLDSLVYAAFGTTPGKAIAGIRVVNDRDGGRLSFPNYFKRNFELYLFGLGLGLPIISLVTLISNYRRAARGELSSWDLSADSHVIARSTNPLRTWIVAVIYIVLFTGLTLLGASDRRTGTRRPVDLSAGTTSSRFEQQLRVTANAINRDGPRMVAPDTRFDDARAGPNLAFTYEYTMTKLKRSELSSQGLEQFQNGARNRLRTAACGQTRLAAMMRVATVLRAHYLDRDGVELGTVEVSRADCPQ